MIFEISLKNARAKVLSDTIDATNSTLNVLTSTGETLVTLVFAQPCATDISNGILTFAPLAEQMILLTGEAFKAEIVSDDETRLATLSISDPDGSGDIKVSRLQFFAGDLLKLSSWQVNEL